MRIAIVNERWTAGATRCARDLQRGLGNRHSVLYLPEGSAVTADDYLQALAKFRPDAVSVHAFYGDLPYSFLGEVSARYPVAYTLHDPRPIGNVMGPCWNCQKNRTCFECPLVGNLKRYTLLQHQYYLSRLEKRRVHARLSESAMIICVSDWMRERVMRTELARLRVERIYNGVDVDRYRRLTTARAELGLPADAKVLAFVAHHAGWKVDERKGQHVLAQALAEIVIPRFPELIVLAVGGGMIANLPNIRPIGFVSPDSVARYYSAADIFVAPSLADNLPYTVLEAMACGTPVVGSRVGGIPEEIEDNKTGLLVAPGSWEELGAALISMLEQPEKTAEMGRAGRKRAEELFQISSFIDNYENIFVSMVEGATAK